MTTYLTIFQPRDDGSIERVDMVDGEVVGSGQSSAAYERGFRAGAQATFNFFASSASSGGGKSDVKSDDVVSDGNGRVWTAKGGCGLPRAGGRMRLRQAVSVIRLNVISKPHRMGVVLFLFGTVISASKKSIKKRRVPMTTEIRLTDQYWDCECEKNYIHHRSVEECGVCHAVRDDQPSSRVDEVIKAGLPISDEVEMLKDGINPKPYNRQRNGAMVSNNSRFIACESVELANAIFDIYQDIVEGQIDGFGKILDVLEKEN